MNEGHVIFARWHDFYVVVGSGAAALTGLVFVVMTLVAGRDASTSGDSGPSPEGMSVYSTPTVVLFSTAFFISAIAVAPLPTGACYGLPIALMGLVGLFYLGRATIRGLRLDGYEADREDRAWFMFLPLVAYAAIAYAGFALSFRVPYTLPVLAVSVLFTVLIGIRNAWDVASYLAIKHDEAE